ncbi:hypothetical protein [Rhizobium sp. BK538]|uniref:hypothetical protein n=1 Tax=Rhizobium sp. BK538 TaxID=2586984 RepID=UPI00162159C6|nr:hypothetical protein [Rhizobium sp. BK538]MBB4171598.1 hypothetical protein [Rhizobium sp. BK538]
MWRNRVAVIPFLMLAVGLPSAAQTSGCSVPEALLDPGTISNNQALKDGIICLLKQVSQVGGQPESGTVEPEDEAAANKVIILANKIIGNGSPAASTQTLLGAVIVAPRTPATSDPSKVVDVNRELSEKIICQANALLGPRSKATVVMGVKCANDPWSKDGVIELANKIIGNG